MISLAMTLQEIAGWVRARLARGERGSSLVEYGLLITLIAVVCLLALNTLGQNTSASYSRFADSLAAAS